MAEPEVEAFSYSNLSSRPPGRFVSVARRFHSGVAHVEDQIAPYAQAWRESNADAVAQRGPLWVVLGDSMSQGIGASAWNHGWVHQAAARLSESGQQFRIVNLSISGARVSDVLERQLPALAGLAAWSDQPEPDLVTVLIGANDVMRHTDRDRLPGDFATMVEQLPRRSVIAPMTQPIRIAREINHEITRVAAERNLVLTTSDPAPGGWRGRLAEDHFHPNDAGYALIAAMFVDGIRRLPALTVDAG